MYSTENHEIDKRIRSGAEADNKSIGVGAQLELNWHQNRIETNWHEHYNHLKWKDWSVLTGSERIAISFFGYKL
jgi:hypothetical protein